MDLLKLSILYTCERDFIHKASGGIGMSDTEIKICAFIHVHPGCSQDNVARALLLDKTTVAKALLSLENKGIVSRKEDQQDRRRNVLNITEHGTELANKLRDRHNARLNELTADFSKEDKEKFFEYIGRILEVSEKWLSEDRDSKKDK